jgi:hypothetical protein
VRAFLFRIVAAAATLFAAAGVSAQPYEVAVAGYSDYCQPITSIRMPYVEWVGVSPSTAGGVTPIAAAPQARVYGIAGSNIVSVRPGSSPVVIATLPALHTGVGLTVDAQGRMYVLVTTGLGNDAIDAFDADGTFVASHPLGARGFGGGTRAGLDLAADQCTLFIIGGPYIRRYDVCRGTFLPDFAMVAPFGGLRVLPDGGVIFANVTHLVRLNSAGVVTRTYTLPLWEEYFTQLAAIALADGGTTVWVTQNGCMRIADHIDLKTGALLESHRMSLDLPTSVVPWSVWTAAIDGAADVEAVPAASTYALLALATLIVMAAVRRIG